MSRFRKKETDDDGEEDIPFLREYQLFNADQCEELPQRFSTHVKSSVRSLERIEVVDQFVRNLSLSKAATKLPILHGWTGHRCRL